MEQGNMKCATNCAFSVFSKKSLTTISMENFLPHSYVPYWIYERTMYVNEFEVLKHSKSTVRRTKFNFYSEIFV